MNTTTLEEIVDEIVYILESPGGDVNGDIDCCIKKLEDEVKNGPDGTQQYIIGLLLWDYTYYHGLELEYRIDWLEVIAVVMHFGLEYIHPNTIDALRRLLAHASYCFHVTPKSVSCPL